MFSAHRGDTYVADTTVSQPTGVLVSKPEVLTFIGSRKLYTTSTEYMHLWSLVRIKFFSTRDSHSDRTFGNDKIHSVLLVLLATTAFVAGRT